MRTSYYRKIELDRQMRNGALVLTPVRREDIAGIRPDLSQQQPKTVLSRDVAVHEDYQNSGTEAAIFQASQELADSTELSTVEGGIILASSDDGNNRLDGNYDDPLLFHAEFAQVQENITRVALGNMGRIETQLRAANSALELVSSRSQPKGGQGNGHAGYSQAAMRAGEANRLKAVHSSLQGRLGQMQSLAFDPQAQTLAVDRDIEGRWGTSVAGLQRKYELAQAQEKDKAMHPSRVTVPDIE